MVPWDVESAGIPFCLQELGTLACFFEIDPKVKNLLAYNASFSQKVIGCFLSGLVKGLMPGVIFVINWDHCKKDTLHYCHAKQTVFFVWQSFLCDK
jgi:hypothetical protein